MLFDLSIVILLVLLYCSVISSYDGNRDFNKIHVTQVPPILANWPVAIPY